MESLSQFATHLALDLAAVLVLTFAVYFPRHRRRDLLPAYLALNVALFAVVAALARVGGDGGMALGFGLFGVLSMIRLRSESIQHEEVAYYFTTLVIGLVSGLPHLPFGLAAALCLLPVAVLYCADHPRLFSRTRRAVVTLDAAVTAPEAVRERIRARLGEPLAWKISEVDFVRDLTVVDVRYRQPAPSAKNESLAASRGRSRSAVRDDSGDSDTRNSGGSDPRTCDTASAAAPAAQLTETAR
ncbi:MULTISPECIES: DUF4956 domain-containing protein [unclassified Streptomyces]|uniref:DUF4956 domain-containing protein n=1 Tax=unclassified Streptomyces TaxID=2593676 RepID=UPI002DDB07A7|nr:MULTISPECIES: DUF4956 domain-containing protein [unclassified Streptomyces]WSB77830.1 DUF4956 domain-containing protein [Streptomyces sp. NBC_01775]WSS13922.1 DUF4956 domain-containing protein [Streptomyces sp. NBC_01186]WSS42736.1 DUF4956 domain-containing protein [Streptomyces sp. NBC_01187]